MTPLEGFQPDLDPSTPGILTDCSNLIPTVSGMAADKALVAATTAAAGACYGAAMVPLLSGTKRQIYGTATKLYEYSGSGWLDRSRVAAYTTGTDSRWRFESFGNVVLATNGADIIQASTTTTFADLSTAPKAQSIVVVSGFAMAFNTTASASSAAGGDSPDGWWCSALYDYTNWTPSVTTQSAYGRLLDQAGPITAAKRLGDSVIVYKANALYLMNYVGPPVIWSSQQISSTVGCESPDGIVNTGTAHIFWSQNNFWIFDGSRPVEIGWPVRKWWMKDSSALYRYKMIGQYDKTNNLARFWYVSAGSNNGKLDRCLVYNINTGKWGRADKAIDQVCDYVAPGVTYDGYPGYPGSTSQSWDTSVEKTYDSPLWMSADVLPSVVSSDYKINTITGTPGETMLLTGDYGNDSQYSNLRRVRGHFITLPTGATLAAEFRPDSGAPYSVSTKTANLNGSKFDILASGRFHRGRIYTQGAMEIAGIEFQLDPGGVR